MADSYIIQLKEHLRATDVISHVKNVTGTFDDEHIEGESIHMFLNLAEHGFPAYSATLSQDALEHILSMDEVAYVEQDGEVHASQNMCQSNPSGEHQQGATWGIARTTNCKGRSGCDTSSVCTGNDCKYFYQNKAVGEGVTVYIMDTGVYCGNNDFTSKQTGSCKCGFDAFGSCASNSDGNGHGTHCASTAAGHTYGVAKDADIVAVKVLNDNGSGTTAGVVNGVDWSAGDGKNKAAVGSMSLGGGASTALDNAVNACTSAGTLVIVAAGNDNKNACNYSPARAANGITVGSTTNTDARSSFSNFGNCVDIFAPGSSITAAWIGQAGATSTISGTSMACPHVTGVAAKMLSKDPSMGTNQLKASVLGSGTSGQVTNPGTGSPNLFSYAFCEQ